MAWQLMAWQPITWQPIAWGDYLMEEHSYIRRPRLNMTSTSRTRPDERFHSLSSSLIAASVASNCPKDSFGKVAAVVVIPYQN